MTKSKPQHNKTQTISENEMQDQRMREQTAALKRNADNTGKLVQEVKYLDVANLIHASMAAFTFLALAFGIWQYTREKAEDRAQTQKIYELELAKTYFERQKVNLLTHMTQEARVTSSDDRAMPHELREFNFKELNEEFSDFAATYKPFVDTVMGITEHDTRRVIFQLLAEGLIVQQSPDVYYLSFDQPRWKNLEIRARQRELLRNYVDESITFAVGENNNLDATQLNNEVEDLLSDNKVVEIIAPKRKDDVKRLIKHRIMYAELNGIIIMNGNGVYQLSDQVELIRTLSDATRPLSDN